VQKESDTKKQNAVDIHVQKEINATSFIFSISWKQKDANLSLSSKILFLHEAKAAARRTRAFNDIFSLSAFVISTSSCTLGSEICFFGLAAFFVGSFLGSTCGKEEGVMN
jgi:hypothetical protein